MIQFVESTIVEVQQLRLERHGLLFVFSVNFFDARLTWCTQLTRLLSCSDRFQAARVPVFGYYIAYIENVWLCKASIHKCNGSICEEWTFATRRRTNRSIEGKAYN